MTPLAITRHAVEQYRSRVIACPERVRTDAQLRSAIRWQTEQYKRDVIHGTLVICVGPWVPRRKKWWEMKLNYPTHLFVVEGGHVITTLGFMMRPKKATAERIKRKRRRDYLKAISRRSGDRCCVADCGGLS